MILCFYLTACEKRDQTEPETRTTHGYVDKKGYILWQTSLTLKAMTLAVVKGQRKPEECPRAYPMVLRRTKTKFGGNGFGIGRSDNDASSEEVKR